MLTCDIKVKLDNIYAKYKKFIASKIKNPANMTAQRIEQIIKEHEDSNSDEQAGTASE